jgi:cellulase/cellobiase CelA1
MVEPRRFREDAALLRHGTIRPQHNAVVSVVAIIAIDAVWLGTPLACWALLARRRWTGVGVAATIVALAVFASVGTSTTTSFSNTGLSANQTFRYQVRARDAAADASGFSTAVPATTSGGGTGGCAVVLTTQTTWQTGYVIQPARVTNNGTATTTWTVTITLPAGHALTGSWNATVTTSGQTVTARGVSHNTPLAPGASGEFGFQASRPNGNTALPTATCSVP